VVALHREQAQNREQPQTSNYAETNRRAWNYLARVHSSASAPWPTGTVAEYRSWLDEFGWLPWRELKTVLLLCGAGGQQGPVFAELGMTVTLVDMSEQQLAIDRRVAAQRGLRIETIRADAHDLSALAGRTFDLVYQPVSTCYFPDPRRCYANVARLLEPGGLYLSDHWNPAQIQLSTDARWDGEGYRVVHPSGTGEPLQVADPSTAEGPPAVYFAHRLHDLLGGICEAGFVIERFAERGAADPGAAPDTTEHLGSYLAPFYEVLARRVETAPTSDEDTTRIGRVVAGDGSVDGARSNRAGAAVVPNQRRRPLRPLASGVLDRADLADRWRRNGFVVLRNAIDDPRLVAALERESLAQQPLAGESVWDSYALSDDGTYISGGMRFHSAQPGQWLSWLHSHPDLQRLLRNATGNRRLAANSNVAYMYYDQRSYIDLHTDVPECESTVLTSVQGRVPPLIAYPRLRGMSPDRLLAVAERWGGRPPGGVALPVPRGGLLIIDGRRLPHRRPSFPAGADGCGIAAMCFAESTSG
jgi:SAM-dependent methyltransferase